MGQAFSHTGRMLYLREKWMSLWGSRFHLAANSERGVCGHGFWFVWCFYITNYPSCLLSFLYPHPQLPFSKGCDSYGSLIQHLFFILWDFVNNYFTTVVLLPSRKCWWQWSGVFTLVHPPSVLFFFFAKRRLKLGDLEGRWHSDKYTLQQWLALYDTNIESREPTREWLLLRGHFPSRIYHLFPVWFLHRDPRTTCFRPWEPELFPPCFFILLTFL